MKRILFLLLFLPLLAISQVVPPDATPLENLQITNNIQSTTATKATVQEDNGVQNFIPIQQLPITNVPVNYSITAPQLGAHLTGIDAKLGALGTTSAGITQRVYFTADNTTVTAGAFFATSLTGKGSTATGSPSALVLADNTKGYFNKDLISIAQPSNTIGYAGSYSGQLTVSASPTPVATQQRFTVEIYRTNNGGTPIASGVSGAPTGDLGVTVIAILDSGIINLTAGSITNIPVSGILTQNITVNTGERLRYHVSAAKIGTGGGNVTFGVYYGSSYNSYYDVPVAITTDAVLNKSTVTGVTLTDALNNNKSLADGKLDELYVNNDFVAQNPPASFSSSVYESFPLMFRGQSNKIFIFYRQGTDHATSKGVIQMRSSNDGGGTWTGASTIISDPTYDCRNVSGGVAPNGRFILFYMRYNFGASTSFDQGYIYSDNEGQTWSNYITIPNSTHTFFSPYGNMISIGDGKIMANWYGETPASPTYSTYVITSSDNGLTWSSAIPVATSTSIRYGEASYAYLDGGIIIGHVRNSVGSPLYQFKSIDNGLTWSAQGQTTIDTGSQVSPDLATYIDPNNQKYVLSFYANRTDLKLKVAYADYTTASSGVSGWSRNDIDTHSISDFGYPTAVKSRENNKFLLAYYKAASTTLASIYFANYTPSYGNISVAGTVSATGNISSNTNVSAVATVSGKDAIASNTLQIKGVIATFPSSGNGLEMYNSTASQTIIQTYNRTGANYNELNLRGSLVAFNIGATQRGQFGASGGFSVGNTTDLGPGTGNFTGNVTTITPTTTNHAATKGYVDGLVRPYKVYTALLSQSGTSAPTATVLENTLGGTVVWSRSSTGTYLGTLSGVFVSGKTICFTNMSPINFDSKISATSQPPNAFQVVTANGSNTLSDSLMTLVSVEVRVYN